jgi:hypothetical protein
MTYHHTQRGTLIVTVCLIVAALSAGLGLWLGQWSVALGVIIPLAVAYLFYSLTVTADAKELRWSFGPGFWTYRLPFDQIDSIATVRNDWKSGFGIRMRPGFRLYNVSGLDAVELRLKSGDVRRIGTDDPRGLAAALNSRLEHV